MLVLLHLCLSQGYTAIPTRTHAPRLRSMILKVGKVIRGQVLSRQECNEVVEAAAMPELEEKLEIADFDSCKALIASSTI